MQMTYIAAIAASLSLTVLSPAHADDLSSRAQPSAPSIADIGAVSPALERYTRDTLFDGLWHCPGLSPRDRSIITLAALITRGQIALLPPYIKRALGSGLKPSEISEIIPHLAFYSGWGNALSAVSVTKDIFAQRSIDVDQLPDASPGLLPINQATEAQRATRVEEQFCMVAPGLVQNTTDVLFHDLWLRPGLTPRDRSLVTISALVASGQVAQIPYHLNRAMDNGLTLAQAGEVATHLAFYAGWPNVFSAMPVFKTVFETRPRPRN
jgi:4-carboxymuconolactone decarboxylase